MHNNTKIAGREIPIETGVLITIYFSAGKSDPAEAGEWEFWTVFNEQGAKTTARCRQGDDPGERFRNMEGKPEYAKHWEIAASAKGSRPAKESDVIDWLNKHPGDSKFAESCSVGSTRMRIVKTDNGFVFE